MPLTPAFHPMAAHEAIVQVGNARFTLLSERLIRLEYDPNAQFEDRATQVYWYRLQAIPEFSQKIDGEWLELETNFLLLRYHIGSRFHWRTLQITLKESDRVWHYGEIDQANLKGTLRTLDSVNGRAPLPDGLISRSGWALVDDVHSLVFDDEGQLTTRNITEFTSDLYFYGFESDYLSAIQEHQLISGRPGLLPRWALGNWWSRYWRYSAEELTGLMDEFQARKIPLSVCIVDMDWHITQTGNRSSGWTGYTWNKCLFPDYRAFLAGLHKRGLKIGLNLHPADGVHPHEEQYPQMARACGLDPESQEPIAFDLVSKEFTKNYFDILHHPYEQKGTTPGEDSSVDFWWIDWQQGTKSKLAGLDPLFALNHLHYYDLGREKNKRPFIFSRWPGLGGQRYPIGFSGDTVVSWPSLAFQPEMTALASNVACSWWSHDIGGHCEGIEDPDLYLRWLQFGVFSPIMRLHSTNCEYIDRRPWAFDEKVFKEAREAMQLRHALIPFLYSANYRCAMTGEPLILPMFYKNPKREEAYALPYQYRFGRDLIVAPNIQPCDPETGLTRQVVWLPGRDYYHFQSWDYYMGGGGWYGIYSAPQDIPVFARVGSLIPMNADPLQQGVANPEHILVKVFAGRLGEQLLYEDDGESQNWEHGAYCTTLLWQSFTEDKLTIHKEASQGDFQNRSIYPQDKRRWSFEIVGITRPLELRATINGHECEVDWSYSETETLLRVSSLSVPHESDLELVLEEVSMIGAFQNPIEKVKKLMRYAKLPSIYKQMFMRRLPEMFKKPELFLEMAHGLSQSQVLAVYEMLFCPQEEAISLDVSEAYHRAMTSFLDMVK